MNRVKRAPPAAQLDKAKHKLKVNRKKLHKMKAHRRASPTAQASG